MRQRLGEQRMEGLQLAGRIDREQVSTQTFLPTTNPQDQHVLISDQPFNVENLCRRCVEVQKHEDEVASWRS